VVAAEDKEVLGVLDLVRQQQADGLERLLASVDVVAEKEVVRLGRETTVLEQAQEVVVLAVDIAANLHRRRQQDCRGGDGGEEMLRKPGGRTLMGASSSSRMGWEMKISRALVQRYRISASSSWTCFPGRLPRTSKRRSMIESRSTSCWSVIVSVGRTAEHAQEGGCRAVGASQGGKAAAASLGRGGGPNVQKYDALLEAAARPTG